MPWIICYRMIKFALIWQRGRQNDDDEYKTANQSYYNIAHSTREDIKEQPKMMVNGTLKHYQVCWAAARMLVVYSEYI